MAEQLDNCYKWQQFIHYRNKPCICLQVMTRRKFEYANKTLWQKASETAVSEENPAVMPGGYLFCILFTQILVFVAAHIHIKNISGQAGAPQPQIRNQRQSEDQTEGSCITPLPF